MLKGKKKEICKHTFISEFYDKFCKFYYIHTESTKDNSPQVILGSGGSYTS